MVEVNLSSRTQQIFSWIEQHNRAELSLRQASLAERFGCSRRTIGRVLSELKQLGWIQDLQKRDDKRCKVYGVVCKPQEISALAKRVWECYHKTFAIVCKFPDLKERYEKIALEFGAIRDESELYSKTFSGLMGS
jgi:DNA-binding MarR family transcriptional regulator